MTVDVNKTIKYNYQLPKYKIDIFYEIYKGQNFYNILCCNCNLPFKLLFYCYVLINMSKFGSIYDKTFQYYSLDNLYFFKKFGHLLSYLFYIYFKPEKILLFIVRFNEWNVAKFIIHPSYSAALWYQIYIFFLQKMMCNNFYKIKVQFSIFILIILKIISSSLSPH